MRTRISAVALLFAGSLEANYIGQWAGSAVDTQGTPTSWNNTAFFSKVNDAMTAAGHSVGPDMLATASNLAMSDLFVVAGASQAFTPEEIAALGSWVNGGGLLLVFTDRSLNSSPLNVMLDGIGSSLHFGPGSMDQNFYLKPGVFASDGVVGQWMGGTPGTVVNGGTGLTRGGTSGWTNTQRAQAEAYIHYEALGSGFVFAFGDRLDHNYFSFAAGSPRLAFFQNLGNFEPSGPVVPPPPDPGIPTDDPPAPPSTDGDGNGVTQTPEPGTLGLMLAGGLVIWNIRLRRGR